MLNRHIRSLLLGLGLATLAPLSALANEIHSATVDGACTGYWHFCSAPTQNTANFNGTAINPGATIWFNANFKASNVPQKGARVFFSQQTIEFTAGGVDRKLQVPDAEIRFSRLVTCSTTKFDRATNTWLTTLPVTGDDEIFLSGLSYLVPSGFGTVTSPVTWSGTFSTPRGSGISAQWKWGAAVYSQYTDHYGRLKVKAGHQTSCSVNNGDHAGTPEGLDRDGTAWKEFVIGGGTGGGGSNFTGSWSGTVSVTPVCNK
jgi:hypothetical protein